MEKTMEQQAVPLQPMVCHSGADLHAVAHRRPHDGAGGCGLGGCNPWRAHTTVSIISVSVIIHVWKISSFKLAGWIFQPPKMCTNEDVYRPYKRRT